MASYKPHVIDKLCQQVRYQEKEKQMSEKFDKKTWRITGGKYSYDSSDVLTREEADAKATEFAAGCYNQVQIWELVGTVQNKIPADIVVTPVTA